MISAVVAGAVLGAVPAAVGRFGPEAPTTSGSDARPVRHATLVRAPTGPPRVGTGLIDHRGEPVTVGCATCHSTRPPGGSAGAPPLRDAAELTTFHQGLTFRHGDLACASCHNAEDGYASLRLAEGVALGFPDVIILCAQCHGPTHADWERGAHGGMTGYWDLTRGGRERNNCIDCHDPHAPAFPRMVPTFKPRDRFLSDGTVKGREGDHVGR